MKVISGNFLFNTEAKNSSMVRLELRNLSLSRDISFNRYGSRYPFGATLGSIDTISSSLISHPNLLTDFRKLESTLKFKKPIFFPCKSSTWLLMFSGISNKTYSRSSSVSLLRHLGNKSFIRNIRAIAAPSAVLPAMPIFLMPPC